MDNKFMERLKNPEMSHRSLPFWAWNEKLDREEIIRQIHSMKEAGAGGFFMHSREGLETEYMGEEWKQSIETAIKEAEKLGMQAWLYDEDRWPSGTAGGRVTAMGDAYRCKGLTLEVLEREQLNQILKEDTSMDSSAGPDGKTGLTALYAAVIHDMEITSYRRMDLNHHCHIESGEILLAVRLEVSAASQWFNHEAPPDNLNPDCVDAFIRKTHETYKALAGSEFGRTVPGIFTDEPSLHDRHAYFGEKKGWIPWTFGFAAYFTEKTGYDFLEFLPELYFHGTNSRKIRHDYWYTLTMRFGETYFKRIGNWCEENHLLFTGHFLQEDKMGLCARVNGGVMPHYQYQHVPGIDMLCEQIQEFLTVKQCTSVASQLGKSFVLSEMYGCTGWDFTFEGQKWMGDWQYVLGVTRRCQHLALYSLRGCRKRDYPPSFHYNTTWWKQNKGVEDYFARLGTALEEGVPVRKVLLLHPASTVWSLLGVNPYGNPVRREERDVPKLNQYGDRFQEFLRYLLEQHFDCDLGDEMLIKDYGRVEEGRFFIGNAGYDAVVIPPVDTLMESTYQILIQWMEEGKTVFLVGNQPFLTDGSEQKKEIRERFLNHSQLVQLNKKEKLLQQLEPYRTVGITDPDGNPDEKILYQLRRTEWGYVLFVVNTDREQPHSIRISMNGEGLWKEMNLLTGECNKVSGIRQIEGKSLLTADYSPCDSRLYLIDKNQIETYVKDPVLTRSNVIDLPKQCQIILSGPNVLTLDMCRYHLENDPLSNLMEVWQAQEKIRKDLGMRSISRNGMEQRYRWINTPHKADGKKLELIFGFDSDCPVKGCQLVVERAKEFEIYINGALLDQSKKDWYLDRSFHTVPVPKVKQGYNEIRLFCAYRNDMELENIYLSGDFSVSPMRRLGKPVKALAVGDWCRQGLFHYSGSVSYQYHFFWHGKGNQILLLMDPTAVCVRVLVNGSSINVPWIYGEPVPITEFIHLGENEIEIELTGSPRNMLGPFHIKEKHPVTTNDACFSPAEKEYEESYQTVFYGLNKRPSIQIMKKQERSRI